MPSNLPNEGISSADVGDVLATEHGQELLECRTMIVDVFSGVRRGLDYHDALRILMATGMPNERATDLIYDLTEK